MNDRPPIPTRWVRAAATDQRQAQQGMFLTAESRRGSDKLANDAYAISLASAEVDRWEAETSCVEDGAANTRSRGDGNFA